MISQAPAARRTVLDFDPTRDGFSFANSFSWTEADFDHLVDKLRPLTLSVFAGLGGALGAPAGRRGALLGAVSGGGVGAVAGDDLIRHIARHWRTFGLCGGMSLAAIERWGSPVPTWDLEKGAMRSLLRRRQAETLRHSLVRFVRQWGTARLDGTAHPPLGRALAEAVDEAARRIEAGRPVILGVVGDSHDPFANHQVVAFGVERGSGPAEATFWVYDPNAPGQTREIRTGLAAHDRRRTAITTTIPTGPRANGCHIASRPGWLASVLVVMRDA